MSLNSALHRVIFGHKVIERLLITSFIGVGLVVPLASASSSAANQKKSAGAVDVLYAGSFLDLMEQHLGPAFHEATGYTVSVIRPALRHSRVRFRGRRWRATSS